MASRKANFDGDRDFWLVEMCPDCAGKGVVESEQWKAWFREQKQLAADGSPESPRPDGPAATQCQSCNGVKFQLTHHGEAFVEALFRMYPHLRQPAAA